MFIFRRRLVVWCLYWCFLAFSSTISQVFTIFYDCLIYKCCTFSPLFYFPNLVKTDLLYIHLQNYMRRDDLVLLEGISNRVFLNLNPVVVTVVITLSLSFLLPQHKVRLKKKHIEQRLTLHFISAFPFTFLLTALIFWESFIQDLPYPVTPKKELVSNNPLQYHSLIKNLGHTDKANDHGWKVLIIKKIISYHHQHLNRKCMGKSMEKSMM